jgi:hypothetical protein
VATRAGGHECLGRQRTGGRPRPVSTPRGSLQQWTTGTDTWTGHVTSLQKTTGRADTPFTTQRQHIRNKSAGPCGLNGGPALPPPGLPARTDTVHGLHGWAAQLPHRQYEMSRPLALRVRGGPVPRGRARPTRFIRHMARGNERTCAALAEDPPSAPNSPIGKAPEITRRNRSAVTQTPLHLLAVVGNCALAVRGARAALRLARGERDA